MKDIRIPQYIYYYTDYDTFKLILEYGTLRFKESTASNDLDDTRRLYNRFLPTITKEIHDNVDDVPEQTFIEGYIKNGHLTDTRVSMVACFTKKADSRMLWDAYTMHRKGREAGKYNGVCIEFDADKLEKALDKATDIDYKVMMPIMYGNDNADGIAKALLDDFSNGVKTLKEDGDQSQSIIAPIRIPFFTSIKEFRLKKCIVYPIITLIDGIDKLAPFCKHSFWREEEEIRALLSHKKALIGEASGIQYAEIETGGYYFYDLPITNECISKVILGPEFSDEDGKGLSRIKGKINYDRIATQPSEGTGVLTNR